jgi:hypothetical protein
VARSAAVRPGGGATERGLPPPDSDVIWGPGDQGDTWTTEASIPEARHNKTVNIADAMSHAKQRDIQQPRLR